MKNVLCIGMMIYHIFIAHGQLTVADKFIFTMKLEIETNLSKSCRNPDVLFLRLLSKSFYRIHTTQTL